MKPLLDTNVLLEQLLRRDGYAAVESLLAGLMKRDIHIEVSFLTMANVAYVLKKGHTKESLQKVLHSVCEYVSILSMNSLHYTLAVGHEPVKDFEDLLQYECAKTNHCDAIITFNKRDFDFSDIPVFTPVEYMQEYNIEI